MHRKGTYMSTILKGAPVVAAMNEANAARCAALQEKGVVPTLAVVRVGERPDDLSYEKGVMARCAKVGVERAVCDYVAGMTDRFAVSTFEKLFVPNSWMMV